jgi:hypothetical protein
MSVGIAVSLIASLRSSSPRMGVKHEKTDERQADRA